MRATMGKAKKMLSRWRRGGRRARPRALYGNLIAYMQTRLREQPADMRLRLALVSHLRLAGRYPEAVHEAEEILRREPSNRRAKSLLLRLRVEQRLAVLQQTMR